MEQHDGALPALTGNAAADRTASSTQVVICFGETMAQLSPSPAGPLEEADFLTLNFAGAESTVAQYLAHFGHEVVWASRLGQDPFGALIEKALAGSGVDTSWVQHDLLRPTGVYFKDPSPTGTKVHYYRTGAAAAAMSAGFLAPALLERADLVHVTGITPALSESCNALTKEVFALRDTHRFSVSFDVNYRPSLWGTRDAASELLAFANEADIVFVGLDEAHELWGAATPGAVRSLIHSPMELIVKDGDVGATLFTADQKVFEPANQVEVVEAVGAGDSFAAGYLHERLAGNDPGERLRTGHRLAAAVLQTTADFVAPKEITRVPEH
jgi:2-dehydro-3-deoxygluconokinase